MTDAHLIKQLLADASELQGRGYAMTAGRIKAMCHRFETLATAHRLLAEREERLTQRIVELTP